MCLISLLIDDLVCFGLTSEHIFSDILKLPLSEIIKNEMVFQTSHDQIGLDGFFCGIT